MSYSLWPRGVASRIQLPSTIYITWDRDADFPDCLGPSFAGKWESESEAGYRVFHIFNSLSALLSKATFTGTKCSWEQDRWRSKRPPFSIDSAAGGTASGTGVGSPDPPPFSKSLQKETMETWYGQAISNIWLSGYYRVSHIFLIDGVVISFFKMQRIAGYQQFEFCGRRYIVYRYIMLWVKYFPETWVLQVSRCHFIYLIAKVHLEICSLPVYTYHYVRM